MANKSKFQAIKGTRDLLPPETALWNQVEQTANDVFRTFGFGEIRVPIFEPTELFARSIGEDTDVVGKEMYTFEDHMLPGFGKDRDELLAAADLLLAADLGDAESLLNFSDDLDILVSRLKRAKSDGELDETNESVVDQLIELKSRTDFSALTGRRTSSLDANPLASSFDELYNEVREAKRLVEKIDLGNLLSLRPEATASVCRAYIEHSMQQLPQPVKLYYMGPMFRRERPQKGRYRQFYQIGAEVLEANRPDSTKDITRELVKDAAIDAELIEMLMTFLDKLELKGIELNINSIGHNAPNCRPAYVELLRAELTKVKDKLGPDSQRRIDTNPLRVLDSKLEFEQGVIEKLPHIADHLCDECKAHYAAVKTQLELRGIIYRENWRLVRGLDYYMRTAFEITAQGLGSQNAVCGGGRYDGLVELLGGPPTKGIGFAIGEDRLILSLQEQARQSEASPERAARASSANSPLATRHSPLIYIAWMGEHAYAAAVRTAKDLRNAGFSVELPPTELKFSKALSHANKLGAKFALILGDNEVSEGLWTLKTLADGTQQKLPEPAIIEHLRQSLPDAKPL
jgi:histidyl-tRNA synthetase